MIRHPVERYTRRGRERLWVAVERGPLWSTAGMPLLPDDVVRHGPSPRLNLSKM
jgi:hypothetical protein